MASKNESQIFRAKTDLAMPSGYPLAHTAGSEFSSSQAQIDTLGWTDNVEVVSERKASPVTTGTPAPGDGRPAAADVADGTADA